MSRAGAAYIGGIGEENDLLTLSMWLFVIRNIIQIADLHNEQILFRIFAFPLDTSISSSRSQGDGLGREGINPSSLYHLCNYTLDMRLLTGRQCHHFISHLNNAQATLPQNHGKSRLGRQTSFRKQNRFKCDRCQYVPIEKSKVNTRCKVRSVSTISPVQTDSGMRLHQEYPMEYKLRCSIDYLIKTFFGKVRGLEARYDYRKTTTPESMPARLRASTQPCIHQNDYRS